MAAPNVEGGVYISPEFQLGQVYMGDEVDPETDQTILYHPVYVCLTEECMPQRPDAHLLQVRLSVVHVCGFLQCAYIFLYVHSS